jgi:DNA modification methylase
VDYAEFLQSKQQRLTDGGFAVPDDALSDKLYDFQRAITRWALRKGRAAIFADCGLGKTPMQLEWAKMIGGTCLIIAPLCVAEQTIREGRKFGYEVSFVRNKEDLFPGINITNYEMTESFDGQIDAVVLDESSILKSLAGKTKQKLIRIFSETRFRLCCTATPCPNDIGELGNHAEFLGICTHAEMLSTFFVHDGNEWRMKGHAEDAFYRWLATWAMCINRPEDLDFDGDAFILPKLNIHHVSVPCKITREDSLFFMGLKGIQDRSTIRKATVDARLAAVREIISGCNGDQVIAWCGLNDEATKLSRLLPDSVNIQGSDSAESKKTGIARFLDGQHRTLITKPRIAGFGMNFQNANKMVFVGLGDSYEQYYQCIRRSWRFGQDKDVDAYVVLSDAEYDIYHNVLQKEAEAKNMSRGLVARMENYEKEELRDGNMVEEITPTKRTGASWEMWHGDCVEITEKLQPHSVDFSVYSPPFISLYTYTATERDIGNSKTTEEFFKHFGFLIRNLLLVTKPGRNTAVHVSQVPAMLVRDGYIGLKDFRGMVVRAYETEGWIYHGEIVIQKNPQAQAVRTKSKSLLFVQLKRDSSWLRPGLADYVCVFRKPGENKVPVRPKDISNDDWIKWAHPVWYDIRETNTLSAAEARTEKDERHVCPLQLDVIDRCVRLWSNPGEFVLSPFAGIGSEGYQSILRGRRFIGVELKQEYFETACLNLQRAEDEMRREKLF